MCSRSQADELSIQSQQSQQSGTHLGHDVSFETDPILVAFWKKQRIQRPLFFLATHWVVRYYLTRRSEFVVCSVFHAWKVMSFASGVLRSRHHSTSSPNHKSSSLLNAMRCLPCLLLAGFTGLAGRKNAQKKTITAVFCTESWNLMKIIASPKTCIDRLW